MLTLDHGLHGNLGALLDEQVHVLAESLGVADADEATRVAQIAVELRESLSIRTSQLHVDELRPRPKLGTVERSTFKLRCRFALRFGEMKDEKGEARAETVRSAFNSPFRPFVLASTSVGQEGLDFHLWCHAVVHWNLPSNPVDLEREGRVHRYKGHAVRKYVALELGRAVLRERWEAGADPWRVLFEEACAPGQRSPRVLALRDGWGREGRAPGAAAAAVAGRRSARAPEAGAGIVPAGVRAAAPGGHAGAPRRAAVAGGHRRGRGRVAHRPLTSRLR